MCTLEIPEGMTEADWEREREIYRVDETQKGGKKSIGGFSEIVVHIIPGTREDAERILGIKIPTYFMN